MRSQHAGPQALRSSARVSKAWPAGIRSPHQAQIRQSGASGSMKSRQTIAPTGWVSSTLLLLSMSKLTVTGSARLPGAGPASPTGSGTRRSRWREPPPCFPRFNRSEWSAGGDAETLRRRRDRQHQIMPVRYGHGAMTAASPTAIRSPYGAPIRRVCSGAERNRLSCATMGSAVGVACGLPGSGSLRSSRPCWPLSAGDYGHWRYAITHKERGPLRSHGK